MARTSFKSPGPNKAMGGPTTGLRDGPVSGAYVTFPFYYTSIAVPTGTGGRISGFKAPFDMRISHMAWGARAYAGATSTITIYQNSTLAVAGATTIYTAAITAAGTAEGSSFASSAARDVTKGTFIVVDPIVANVAPTDLYFIITAYAQGHAVAAGPSAD